VYSRSPTSTNAAQYAGCANGLSPLTRFRACAGRAAGQATNSDRQRQKRRQVMIGRLASCRRTKHGLPGGYRKNTAEVDGVKESPTRVFPAMVCRPGNVVFLG